MAGSGKSSSHNKRKSMHKQNRLTMLGITMVVLLLLTLLLYQGHSLRGKIAENSKKEAVLNEKIADEDKRTDEIGDLKDYMQSDEYKEKTAKDKLGLVDDNEIIFKKQ